MQPDEVIRADEISKQAAFDAQNKIIHSDSFTVPKEEHTLNPQDP